MELNYRRGRRERSGSGERIGVEGGMGEEEWKKGGERRGDGSGKREGIGEEGGKGNYWE